MALSLTAIKINGDFPRQIEFNPTIKAVTTESNGSHTSYPLGFVLSISCGKTKIDYLEYQYLAINDDRLTLKCDYLTDLPQSSSREISKETIPLDFGRFSFYFFIALRFFWSPPSVALFLVGFYSTSQK